LGKPDFEFPEALSDILHLNEEGELDLFLRMLIVSPDELLNCFFTKCDEDVYYEHKTSQVVYKKIYANNVAMLLENTTTQEGTLFKNTLVEEELILFI